MLTGQSGPNEGWAAEIQLPFGLRKGRPGGLPGLPSRRGKKSRRPGLHGFLRLTLSPLFYHPTPFFPVKKAPVFRVTAPLPKWSPLLSFSPVQASRG